MNPKLVKPTISNPNLVKPTIPNPKFVKPTIPNPNLVKPTIPNLMKQTATRLLLLAMLLIGITGVSNAQFLGYDVTHVVNTLRHPQNDLVSVCAHRGLFSSVDLPINGAYGIPENSLSAIRDAVYSRVEMVELDIKLSSDGIPVIMHDQTLHRTTNVNTLYPNLGSNPRVEWLTSGDLQRLQLKNAAGYLTSSHLPTLEQALDFIYAERFGVVLTLDIKDRTATRACWDLVKRKQNAYGVPATDWVLFKLGATIYGENPATLENDLGLNACRNNCTSTWGNYFKYFPYFGTNMVDQINCINTYNNFKNKPYFVCAEVLLKQDGGLLANIVNQIQYDQYTTGRKHLLAAFHAFPDAPNNRYWLDGGFATYVLSDLYYTSQCCGRDTQDKRDNFLWEVGYGAHLITSDVPTSVMELLGSQNRRNVAWYSSNWASRAAAADSTIKTSQSNAAFGSATGLGLSGSLEVFPNPTEGRLTIHLPLSKAVAGSIQVTLFDKLGVKVYQKALPSTGMEINLKETGLTQGVYMLEAILPDGQKTPLKRIVVL